MRVNSLDPGTASHQAHLVDARHNEHVADFVPELDAERIMARLAAATNNKCAGVAVGQRLLHLAGEREGETRKNGVQRVKGNLLLEQRSEKRHTLTPAVMHVQRKPVTLTCARVKLDRYQGSSRRPCEAVLMSSSFCGGSAAAVTPSYRAAKGADVQPECRAPWRAPTLQQQHAHTCPCGTNTACVSSLVSGSDFFVSV